MNKKRKEKLYKALATSTGILACLILITMLGLILLELIKISMIPSVVLILLLIIGVLNVILYIILSGKY